MNFNETKPPIVVDKAESDSYAGITELKNLSSLIPLWASISRFKPTSHFQVRDNG